MILFLSFVNPRLPEGCRFIGGALVEVEYRGDPIATFHDAIAISIIAGCNPGGEVASFICPPEYEEYFQPYLNKLMSYMETDAVFRNAPLGGGIVGMRVN